MHEVANAKQTTPEPNEEGSGVHSSVAEAQVVFSAAQLLRQGAIEQALSRSIGEAFGSPVGLHRKDTTHPLASQAIHQGRPVTDSRGGVFEVAVPAFFGANPEGAITLRLRNNPGESTSAILGAVADLVGAALSREHSDDPRIEAFDASPIAQLLVDGSGQVVHASKAAARSLRELGRSADTDGKHLTEVFGTSCSAQAGGHPSECSIGASTIRVSAEATEAGYRVVAWENITSSLRAEEDRKDQEASRLQAEASRADHGNRVRDVVLAAQEGDLTRRVSGAAEGTIGEIGESLGQFLDDLRGSVAGIKGSTTHLNTASSGIAEISQTLASNAEETSERAATVSSSAEEVSRNVSTVAAGIEELSASVKEIASNAKDAASVATEGVKVANETNETVAQLGESSAEIGKVIKVITSIAQQTNLLALNATIEAARAGSAGKGFAVVANEVKELAKETARATEDISQKIETIQGDTGRAVEAIDRISSIINQVNEIQATIALAVDEQRTTTNEIGRSIAVAAQGSSEIASNITSVADAARSTTVAASDAQSAADQLQQLSAELGTLVARFET